MGPMRRRIWHRDDGGEGNAEVGGEREVVAEGEVRGYGRLVGEEEGAGRE